MLYIADGDEPEDKWETRHLKARAAHYIMLNDGLFWYSAHGKLFICMNGIKIMAETHESFGKNHSRGRALALKIRKYGNYWQLWLLIAKSL